MVADSAMKEKGSPGEGGAARPRTRMFVRPAVCRFLSLELSGDGCFVLTYSWVTDIHFISQETAGDTE